MLDFLLKTLDLPASPPNALARRAAVWGLVGEHFLHAHYLGLCVPVTSLHSFQANIGCSERGYEAIRSVRKSFSVWLDANVKTSADLVFRAYGWLTAFAVVLPVVFMCCLHDSRTCLLAVQLICAGNPRAQLDFQALDWSCGVVCLPNKPSDLFNVQHSTERTLSPPKSRSRTDATVSELQYLHVSPLLM